VSDNSTLSPKEHWDSIYQSGQQTYPGPRRNDLTWHRNIALFDLLFSKSTGKGERLIEIGAALSQYMILFRERYGYEVHGLDYSQEGCDRTLQGMADAKFDLGGTMYCMDLLGDLSELEGQFDVVTSFGVIEHFEDPVPILRILYRLLRPGGKIFTSIPNTPGLVFSLYKWIDRSIYNMHVQLTDSDLERVHLTAGFLVKYCGYYGSFNPDVLSSGCPSKRSTLVQWTGARLRRIVWPFLKCMDWYPESSMLSPYIVCMAKADADAFSHVE